MVVPDRAHQRGAARGRDADERLVAERQQVLERPAAARDDDHVDPGSRRARRSPRSPPAPRAGPAPSRAGSRSRRPPTGRARWRRRRARRPPAAPRSGRWSRGRNGRARLRLGSNSPSAPRMPLRCSIRASSSPRPTSRTSSAANVSVALLGMELRPRVHHEVRAVGDRVGQRAHRRRGHRDRQRHVEVGVPQREEVEGVPPLEVEHLPLDPDGRHLGDVVGDLGRQVPHRPRAVRRGVGGLQRPRTRGRGRDDRSRLVHAAQARCSRPQPAPSRPHRRRRHLGRVDAMDVTCRSAALTAAIGRSCGRPN